jgi:hypothetical protein
MARFCQVLFWMLFFRFINQLDCRSSHEDEEICNAKNVVIHAAMIADMEPHKTDPNDIRWYNFVTNFCKEVFSTSHQEIEFVYWPPIWSKKCYDVTATEFDKGRGSNLAHKEAWDSFYRQRKSCADVLVVFEYDAMEGLPNHEAGRITVDYLMNMTHDFLYLGHCYKFDHLHPRLSREAPYCLHSYAMTVKGARKLLHEVDACGPFADVQVARMCNDGRLHWSYVNHSFDHSYVHRQFEENGMHMSGDFKYDGLFPQIKLEPVPNLPDGSVGHNHLSPRTLYLLQNQTWRQIPNMDVYGKLGLEGKGVSLLTNWQFRKYPEGPPLPSD